MVVCCVFFSLQLIFRTQSSACTSLLKSSFYSGTVKIKPVLMRGWGQNSFLHFWYNLMNITPYITPFLFFFFFNQCLSLYLLYLVTCWIIQRHNFYLIPLCTGYVKYFSSSFPFMCSQGATTIPPQRIQVLANNKIVRLLFCSRKKKKSWIKKIKSF